MNERFMFRVWSNKCKNYIDNDPAIIDHSENQYFEIAAPGTDCIIEQCTGLKDKNGKWIFEGDILHLCGMSFNYKATIIWHKNSGSWQIIEENKVKHIMVDSAMEESAEIIGTIHEVNQSNRKA